MVGDGVKIDRMYLIIVSSIIKKGIICTTYSSDTSDTNAVSRMYLSIPWLLLFVGVDEIPSQSHFVVLITCVYQVSARYWRTVSNFFLGCTLPRIVTLSTTEDQVNNEYSVGSIKQPRLCCREIRLVGQA